MKYMVIHGIGDYTDNWLDKKAASLLLGCSEEDIVEFQYDTLIEESKGFRVAARWARVFAFLLTWKYPHVVKAFRGSGVKIFDYLIDWWVYRYSEKTKQAVLEKFRKVYNEEQPDVVIGHSLGSLVALEVCSKMDSPVEQLVTLGSPLGSLWLASFADNGLSVGNTIIKDWFNLYDVNDKIGGPIIRGFSNVKALSNTPIQSDKKTTRKAHDLYHYLAFLN